MYRVTLIAVFLGHFRINLHKTRTQYSNEGLQHWNAAQFKKMLSECGILSPKTVVLTFCGVSSKFAAVIMTSRPLRTRPLLDIDVSGLIQHTKTNGQWSPKYVQITVDSNSYASAM